MNKFFGQWEQVAIGGENGEIELVCPEKGAWYGSVSPAVTPLLKNSQNPVIQTVPLRKLDDYLKDSPHSNILIKIDVEGFEREVLQGASCLLNTCRLKLIFESNDPDTRDELFNLLAGYGYGIYSLPWQPIGEARALDIIVFRTNAATNFLAIKFAAQSGANCDCRP